MRTGSLQSNEVDAITSIGQQDEAPLTAAGVQLLARANPGLPFQIAFNLSKPVVSDPAVRTALSLSINRPEVVSAIYTSQTKPATSALASSTPRTTPTSRRSSGSTSRRRSRPSTAQAGPADRTASAPRTGSA